VLSTNLDYHQRCWWHRVFLRQRTVVDADQRGGWTQILAVWCLSWRLVDKSNKNSSGHAIANVKFLRYLTRTSKHQKRELTSFNKLYDSSASTAHWVLNLWICYRGRRAVPLQTFTTRRSNRKMSIVIALSTTFTQCAPETTNFGKITQNKDHFAVQGHSRSPILVPIESSYTLHISR